MSIILREKKMKGFLKTSAGLVALVLSVAFFKTDVSASTGIYIGKDASSEGTTVIGVSLESDLGEANVTEIVEKGSILKGDVIESQSGFKYTMPEDNVKMIVGKNMAYVGSGGWNNCAANENGVSIVSYITTDPNMDAVIADPFVENGICEDRIPMILAATSKSAKEAVKTLCSIYEETGADAAEIVLIADKEGAWAVENYTGHQYAAVKLPDDCIATFANEPIIRYADPEDKDTICSSELFTLPEKNDFAVYGSDKKLDLILTYNADNQYSEEAHLRGWVGHDLFAPSEELDFDDEEGYDVFFKPDEKVSLDQAFDFFRNRFEGTQYDLSDEDNALYYGINNQFVTGASIIQLFDDVPDAMSAVLWSAPANPTASPFVPIPVIADELPANLGTDAETEGYDNDILQFSLAMLNNKVLSHRRAYGDSIRQYWEGMESLSVKEITENIRGDWKKDYESSNEDAAKAADEYLEDAAGKLDDDAGRLSEELEWFIYKNGVRKTTVSDDELVPFECSFDAVAFAKANGWETEVNDDTFTAEKDGKTITVVLSGEDEGVVTLEGFDNQKLMEDFMSIEQFETEEAEEAENEEETEKAEEEVEPKEAEKSEEDKKEEAEKSEEVAETDEEVIEEIASEASKQIEVDTIAELNTYFNEKIAAVPRDGWAEAQIANEFAGISNDVTGIIGKYFNGAGIEDLIGFDVNKLANDADVAKVGEKVAEAGLDLSALVEKYFNSLAEDVSADIVDGRLSQEGAVRILTEAEGNIEGIAKLYLEGITGAFSEVFNTDLSAEEFAETLAELGDGAIDMMEEYGGMSRESLGLGDTKLADLTDADIDVVITLNEMDEDVINGLSELLGVDVRKTLDEYIEQINAQSNNTKVVEEKHEIEKADSAPDPMVMAAIEQIEDEYAADDDYVVPQEIIDILNEAIAEAEAAAEADGSDDGAAVVDALSEVLEAALENSENAENDTAADASDAGSTGADYDDVYTVNIGKIVKNGGTIMLPSYMLRYFR